MTHPQRMGARVAANDVAPSLQRADARRVEKAPRADVVDGHKKMTPTAVALERVGRGERAHTAIIERDCREQALRHVERNGLEVRFKLRGRHFVPCRIATGKP